MKNITIKLIFILLAFETIAFIGCNMFGGDDDNDIVIPVRQEATGISFIKNTLDIDGAEDTYLQYTVTPKGVSEAR